MSALVEIQDICKIYNPGENEVKALNHVSLTIDENEFVAIIGQSGSGKSTLMYLLGCLDTPTSGNYFLHGQDVSHMSDNELSDVRNKEIGFIFQGFNLIDCVGERGTAVDLSGGRKTGAAETRRYGARQGGTGKKKDA